MHNGGGLGAVLAVMRERLDAPGRDRTRRSGADSDCLRWAMACLRHVSLRALFRVYGVRT